jgi:hypothetical protein
VTGHHWAKLQRISGQPRVSRQSRPPKLACELLMSAAAAGPPASPSHPKAVVPGHPLMADHRQPLRLSGVKLGLLLYGSEVAEPADAGRPTAVLHFADLAAGKRSLALDMIAVGEACPGCGLTPCAGTRPGAGPAVRRPEVGRASEASTSPLEPRWSSQTLRPTLQRQTAAGAASLDASARHHRNQGEP